MRQLQNDLKARSHTIETLREQIDKLEVGPVSRPEREDGDEEQASQATLPSSQDSAGGQQQQIDALQRDLRARDATIKNLREQIGKLDADPTE